MTPLQPFPIFGAKGGMVTNKKPVFLPDDAFPVLENAYVWRERLLKRQGIKFLGRLRRQISVLLTNQASGTSYAVADVLNDAAINVRATEPNAEIQEGRFLISMGGVIIDFVDNGDGTLSTNPPSGNVGTINYVTGALSLTFSPAIPPSNVFVNFFYFPALPVMGIWTRELAGINDEQVIWFDTKYAYYWPGGAGVNNFIEFVGDGTTWTGGNSDFFWSYNYRGASPSDRLFFTTNFTVDPIRYTSADPAIAWTSFAPILTDMPESSSKTKLFRARLIIAYYGRLLLMNTYEGTAIDVVTNFFNRCRFSQLGAPIDADAFRSDKFGKGGFLDAPTNEQITGCTFIKNTLVVDFERTTWQLRYVGEYGLPFIWERVSADYGSESTFSGVLFDNYRLAVGDKAITAGTANEVKRIDDDIPDTVFTFQNSNSGVKRVWGVRDYQRELVFWNYVDGRTEAAPGVSTIFPNQVLVYNYKNNTWAIFRDNVTAFGTFQLTNNITWSNDFIFWNDTEVFWNDFDLEQNFPSIVIGNQQGYAHEYGYTTPDQASLAIYAVNLLATPAQFTVINHNLQNGEIVYLSGMEFFDSTAVIPITSISLNDKIYSVVVVDKDTITLDQWDFTLQQYVDDFTFTYVPSSSALAHLVYIGAGQLALFPLLNVQTKDINLFMTKGLTTKLSYIDFLMETTDSAAMTVNLNVNTSPSVSSAFPISGNVFIGQVNMRTSTSNDFYPPLSDYAWYRFYGTLSGQFFSVNLTYNDDLMNTLATHEQNWVMLGMQAWCRPGGRNQF